MSDDVFANARWRLQRRVNVFRAIRNSLSELEKAREFDKDPDPYFQAIKELTWLYNQAAACMERTAQDFLDEAELQEKPSHE